jgi:hypothetical protein
LKHLVDLAILGGIQFEETGAERKNEREIDRERELEREGGGLLLPPSSTYAANEQSNI